MQDYQGMAKKNGIELLDEGDCQFCGAKAVRGIADCLNVFDVSFNSPFLLEDIYRFLIVDSHALQHPEIHGRWSNHLHLTRLYLIFKYNLEWNYKSTPKLSECLNNYKLDHPNEHLIVPEIGKRGSLTSQDIQENKSEEEALKSTIHSWARSVYEAWELNHKTVDQIALNYIEKYQ